MKRTFKTLLLLQSKSIADKVKQIGSQKSKPQVKTKSNSLSLKKLDEGQTHSLPTTRPKCEEKANPKAKEARKAYCLKHWRHRNGD